MEDEDAIGDVIFEHDAGVVSVGAELVDPPLQGLLEAAAAVGMKRRNKRLFQDRKRSYLYFSFEKPHRVIKGVLP